MTKKELAANLMENVKGIETKAQAERIVNDIFAQVTGALVAGEKVALADFGSLQVKQTAARKGRNPQTGEEIQIPAKKSVKFKAAKALSESVNK